MPAFVWAIGSMFIRIAGSFVGRALLSLGIGVATYIGVNASMAWAKQQAVQSITALPPEVLGMLGTMKVGQCISIVFSAMVMRSVVNGVQSDTFKRFVVR